MMATVGQLGKFDPEEEKISAYLERVELYLIANGVKEDRKVAVLLSAIGPKVYATLRDLLAPKKPHEVAMKDLFETLQKHFEPPSNVISERFQFHRRDQGSGESVTEFLAELRRLATNCQFGEYLDQALRDRFVCGLHSSGMQKSLLAVTDDLPLKKAVDQALAYEAADKSTKDIQEGHFAQSSLVDKVSVPFTRRSKSCYRCGKGNHSPNDCRYRDFVCDNCGKRGHLAKVCHADSKLSQKPKGAKWVDVRTDSGDEETIVFDDAIFCVKDTRVRPLLIQLELDGATVPFEVDTGAAVTIISQRTKQEFLPQVCLKPSQVTLQTYTAQPMKVLGELHVNVKYGKYDGIHKLFVVEGSGPNLMGRNWLYYIQLDWQSLGISAVTENPTILRNMLTKYKEIFQDGLGTMRDFTAKLTLKNDAKPKFCRPRSVPFALKEPIERELKRLEAMGVLQPVKHSEWATPLVPVPKADGNVRLCGDYKVTVNPVLNVDQYPLPKPQELLATLTNGQKFTKLDLSAAYQQMLLDEESAKLVTVNTHLGLFRYCRLPFGVAAAPAIFQRAMDTLLQGVPNVICYIDDLLVTGQSDEEHLRNLEKVLHLLKEQGIRLKQEKCSFLQSEVEYLGYRIDEKGIHTSPSKLEAIQQAPTPTNTTELRSFLGLLNYYGKFIPNLSTMIYPLNALLRQGARWKWSTQCEASFKEAKHALSSASVLAHYDPTLPLQLAGDASCYGVGAVLSHRYPDGTERPIAFASRTLLPSERNYAQIEREALSLVFGTQKFHQYIYGRQFTLITDHRPLTTIFGDKRGIPPVAAARLQRWALLLSAYHYNIVFKPTKSHANADCFSRLPISGNGAVGNPTDVTLFNLSQISFLPVNEADMVAATRTDPLLGTVLRYSKSGWPVKFSPEMKPYWTRREQLIIENNILLWGMRVVVPASLRSKVLEELHEGHPGMNKMKQLARSHVWWPNIDTDIEEASKACQSCQEGRNSPPEAPLHPWIWPSNPWIRIHVDFAGPFLNRMFLVVIDAYSKWPEVVEMCTGPAGVSAIRTVEELRRIFATHGLPQQLVSDNGPQFVSQQLAEFLKMNGIKHFRSAPYHPSTNGMAERFIQTMKKALRASKSEGTVSQRLAKFLLSYRTSPHATTKRPPCELRAVHYALDWIS